MQTVTFLTARAPWVFNKNPPTWTENQIWQGHLSNSQANDLRDLLLFGKDVKVFFNEYHNFFDI